MKKTILLTIVVAVLCLSSCSATQGDSYEINKILMLEKNKDKLFYYYNDYTDNTSILSACSTHDGNILDIYRQDYSSDASFSIIKDKIYFIDSNILYSKPISNLNSQTDIEGKLSDDIKEMKSGNYNGHYNIFEFQGNVYIQGCALYHLNNGEIKEIKKDVSSYTIYDNTFYYGDSQGNIFKTDDMDRRGDVVISKDEIEALGDPYVSVLAGNFSINNLQIFEDKIFFILSPDCFSPGHVLSYNMSRKCFNWACMKNGIYENSFIVKHNAIYCYGMFDTYKNALFKIVDNECKLLYPYTSGFCIIDNNIYLKDGDNGSIYKMDFDGKNKIIVVQETYK